MKQLNWRSAAAAELSALLSQCTLEDSRAIGPSTVYRLSQQGHELLAIALPDGQAVVVDLHTQPGKKRRRIEPQTP